MYASLKKDIETFSPIVRQIVCLDDGRILYGSTTGVLWPHAAYRIIEKALRKSKDVDAITKFPRIVTQETVSPTGQHVLFGHSGLAGHYQLWHIGGTLLRSFEFGKRLNSVNFSDCGKYITFSGKGLFNDRVFYRLADCIQIFSLPCTAVAHHDHVSLIVSKDEKYIVIVSERTRYGYIFRAHNGCLTHVYDIGKTCLTAFSPDSLNLVFTALDAKQLVLVYNTETAHQTSVMVPSTPSSISISPDSKILAVGLWDATIRLFDMSNLQKPPKVLRFHSTFISCVQFVPNGQLMTACGNNLVFTWNLCEWTDRVHHLFHKHLKKRVFLLMCAKQRLERASTRSRGLPCIPMTAWLDIFRNIWLLHDSTIRLSVDT